VRVFACGVGSRLGVRLDDVIVDHLFAINVRVCICIRTRVRMCMCACVCVFGCRALKTALKIASEGHLRARACVCEPMCVSRR